MNMPLSQEDKDILLTQSGSKTSAEWFDYFDQKYSKKQIYDFCYTKCSQRPKRLSKAEQSKIQSQNARKYNINQDYFKTWSRNMAYVFGLWCADGCIYGGKMFDITLHKKDKYLLKMVANELGYEGHLYDYVDRQAARLNFSCKVIYDDIIALGGTEAKSLTLQFPNVPKKYLPDFIRGYFDGNGCVMRLKGKRINSAFTCGSREFLESLLFILRDETGVKGGSFDGSCMSLKFGKRDSLLLGEYMYQNNPSIFLKRKRDKFQAIGEPKGIPSHSPLLESDVETNSLNRL